MTEKEQLVAIAEVCPFVTHLQGTDAYVWMAPRTDIETGQIVAIRTLFDPLHDLNAMHEAENHLLAIPVFGENKHAITYKRFLEGAGTYDVPFYRATAAQRAKAFLRTIGKWKE